MLMRRFVLLVLIPVSGAFAEPFVQPSSQPQIMPLNLGTEATPSPAPQAVPDKSQNPSANTNSPDMEKFVTHSYQEYIENGLQKAINDLEARGLINPVNRVEIQKVLLENLTAAAGFQMSQQMERSIYMKTFLTRLRKTPPEDRLDFVDEALKDPYWNYEERMQFSKIRTRLEQKSASGPVDLDEILLNAPKKPPSIPVSTSKP